jgi:hypothetical protein
LTKPLEELGNIEKNRGELHKHRAYATAVHSLKAHPYPITSGEEAKSLRISFVFFQLLNVSFAID